MTGTIEIAPRAPHALDTVHEMLVAALAILNEIGEHVVAAQVSSSIDAIEQRRCARPEKSEASALIANMATALTRVFGPRAREVAARQAGEASGEAAETWAAIERRLPPPQG